MTISPRIGAALLAALGLVAITPLAVADMLWLGPWMLGAGIGEDPVFIVFGLGIFIVAALPLLCLGLAVPAWRGSRAAAITGAALALLIAALSLTPVRLLSPLSWLGIGRWLLLAVALAAVVALAAAAGGAGERARGRGGAWAPALVGCLLAVILVGAGVAGRLGSGIPGVPSGLLAADLRGGERLTGEPLAARPPRPAPGLLRGQGSNIHNDGAMSDVYFGRHTVDPATAGVRSFRALGDCASILFDHRGRLIAVCVGGTRTVVHVLDPRTLEPLAERRIADRSPGLDFATEFAGGGYAVLDNRGRLVVPGTGGTIDRFRITAGAGGVEIEPLDSFDIAEALAPGEPITSALPDASGRLWFVGADGTVGLLNLGSGAARSIRFERTEIENSFALAPNGDALVVTSDRLMRVAAGPGGRPRVVWEEGYDLGTRRKPGQTSRGSGTTPTMMLDGRYVAITDNAEPRMNVQVYAAGRRVRGPRLACEAPVFAAGRSATENALIAAGRSIFVESNYGYRLIDVIGGHSSEPGVARVDFDPRDRTCGLAWQNDELRVPSVVSKVSVADGTMLTYTKPTHAAGIDTWYFTAVDAGTGQVLWERLAGTGGLANNHYAAIYLGPSGDLYVGTTGGVIGLLGGDG